MPVFFYLDPDLLNDLNMKGVETVTLNYTFFSKPQPPKRFTLSFFLTIAIRLYMLVGLLTNINRGTIR